MEYNALGGVYRGAYGLGNIPDDIKKYDQDKAGFLFYKKRGMARLMSMVAKRFGRRPVTSMEPKWHNVGELDHVFICQQSQDLGTAADWKRIVMSNEQARQLQPNDLLAVDSLYLSDGYDDLANIGKYSKNWTPSFGLEEPVMVEREPIDDSAGAGKSYVYVRRGFVANTSTGRPISEPVAQQDGLILKDMRLLKISNAQWTGSDAPRGKSKNIEIDGNYCQIFRYAYENQYEYNYEETYLKEDQMSINQKLTLNAMVYEMEYRALFGRKFREASGESMRYTTGGVFEYIQQLGKDNAIDYSDNGAVNAYTWLDWQRAAAKLFELGGSGSRTMFCSIGQFSNLLTMLWDKVRISVNSKLSEEFKFEIYTIMSGSGNLHFVPSWVYGQNHGRSNMMLALDFDQPNFKVDVREDLKKETNMQLPGQRLKKDGFVATLGMQRRGISHGLVYGLPSLNPPVQP
ncbi:MAG: DUF5309 family protein [Bacteroidetes bacterium]|nr:DUF5309 family protein [Bacteroidota bacterium]